MTKRLLGPIMLLVVLLIAVVIDAGRNSAVSEVVLEESASVPTTISGAAGTAATVESVAPSTTVTESTTTTEFTTTTTAPSAREVAEEVARSIIEKMTAEERLSQLFIVEVEPENAAQALSADSWGGLFLKMEDFSPAETTSIVGAAQTAAAESSSVGAFISSDVEGGRITKMPVDPIDLPGLLAELPNEAILTEYRDLADELCVLGVNLNLAPVGDVDEFSNPVLANGRSFSTDPSAVANYVSIVLDAYASAGLSSAPVATTTKHFPGHGAASLDSHNSGAAVGPREELEGTHVLPFKSAIEQYQTQPGAIMIGHLTVGDETEPATFSHEVVTEWLRNDLGHDGVVISDDLANMAAVTDRPEAERARLALIAGIDILLWNDLAKATQAKNALSEEISLNPDGDVARAASASLLRILTLKVELGLASDGRPTC